PPWGCPPARRQQRQVPASPPHADYVLPTATTERCPKNQSPRIPPLALGKNFVLPVGPRLCPARAYSQRIKSGPWPSFAIGENSIDVNDIQRTVLAVAAEKRADNVGCLAFLADRKP